MIPKYPDIECLTVDDDTKQKLLNGTWPPYFDIDLKHIQNQMMKVDVASFSSCLLFAIIFYEFQKHL